MTTTKKTVKYPSGIQSIRNQPYPILNTINHEDRTGSIDVVNEVKASGFKTLLQPLCGLPPVAFIDLPVQQHKQLPVAIQGYTRTGGAG
jgi:hypothetical protein